MVSGTADTIRCGRGPAPGHGVGHLFSLCLDHLLNLDLNLLLILFHSLYLDVLLNLFLILYLNLYLNLLLDISLSLLLGFSLSLLLSLFLGLSLGRLLNFYLGLLLSLYLDLYLSLCLSLSLTFSSISPQHRFSRSPERGGLSPAPTCVLCTVSCVLSGDDRLLHVSEALGVEAIEVDPVRHLPTTAVHRIKAVLV